MTVRQEVFYLVKIFLSNKSFTVWFTDSVAANSATSPILARTQPTPFVCRLERWHLKATRGTIPRKHPLTRQCEHGLRMGVAEFKEKYSPIDPSPALFVEQTVYKKLFVFLSWKILII